MRLINKLNMCFSLAVLFGLGCLLSLCMSQQSLAMQSPQDDDESFERLTSKLRNAMIAKPSKSAARNDEIRKKLDRTVSLIYDSAPFEDLQQMLMNELEINVVIDPNLEGIVDAGTEVSANLTDIRLADGLRSMLRFVDATFVVKDGILRIISIDDENEPEYLVRRMVDVRDLLTHLGKASATNQPEVRASAAGVGGARNQTRKKVSSFGSSGAMPAKPAVQKKSNVAKLDSTPENQLIDTVTNIISSDSWTRNGSGNGEIRCVGGILIVTNNEKVSEDVLTFAQDLKYEIKSRLK